MKYYVVFARRGATLGLGNTRKKKRKLDPRLVSWGERGRN